MIKYLLAFALVTFTLPTVYAKPFQADHCVDEAEFAIASGTRNAHMEDRLQNPRDGSIINVYHHESGYFVIRFVNGCAVELFGPLSEEEVQRGSEQRGLIRKAD